jgi:hypothetical protein
VAAAGGEVVAALGVVATRLEAVLASNERLEAEVAALRSEVEAVRALPASERSPAVEGGQRVGESPGEGQREADGPLVRVALWFEHTVKAISKGRE